MAIGTSRSSTTGRLLRRGPLLEAVTLGWNVVGVVVLGFVAVSARSVALAGIGLDSFMIGIAFVLLAVYLTTQSPSSLLAGFRAAPVAS